MGLSDSDVLSIDTIRSSSKLTLRIVQLKMNKLQIKKLLAVYPALHSCLSGMTVIKENEFYYLEISPCFLDVVARDSITKIGTLASNYYFPQMRQPIIEDFRYSRFSNFFSEPDPFFKNHNDDTNT